MGEERWGERDAEWYDELAADMFAPEVVEPAVGVLAELAGDGAALELGIGTGRIALPLAQRGVRVCGIDVSAPMVAKLREKPGAEQIDVTIGSFVSTRIEGTFALVYLVWNAITNLTTQDEQVACVQNAAAHLESGGCLVIEIDVPDLRRLPPGETVRPFNVSATRVGFDEYDVVAQIQVSHHFWKVGDTFQASSAPYRYCGHQSLTSWRGSPACSYASAGAAGRANRSRATARGVSPFGRRRPPLPALSNAPDNMSQRPQPSRRRIGLADLAGARVRWLGCRGLKGTFAFQRSTLVLLLSQPRLAASAIEVADVTRLASSPFMCLRRAQMRLLGPLMRRNPARTMVGAAHRTIIAGPPGDSFEP